MATESRHSPSDTLPDCPPPTYDDVQQAGRRIQPYAHRTPVVTCQSIDRMGQREFFFKCENLQKVGAFKFRGAMNAVLQLPESKLKHGVVTHSSGNHAQALALAARLRGAPAYIVMPTTSNPKKRAAVIEYGAEVIDCAATLEARETTAAELQSRTGATMVHPYDHPHIIAGQGTAAAELMEQVPDLDLVIAPVGGGGLISGTSLVATHHGVPVWAAEPAGADDAARSKAAGRLIPQTNPQTIADGLLTSLGQWTWPFVRDVVQRVVTVDDRRIIEAMRLFFERSKYLIEPSSAVAVAVALSAELADCSQFQRVGVILSGGNVDLDRLPWA